MLVATGLLHQSPDAPTMARSPRRHARANATRPSASRWRPTPPANPGTA